MNRRTILAIFVIAFLAIIGHRTWQLWSLSASPSTTAALVYDSDETAAHPQTQAMWSRYLSEQHVAYTWVSTDELLLVSGSRPPSRFVALFFVNRIARYVPPQLEPIVRKYVDDGGVLGVVRDAGTLRDDGKPLRRSTFANLVGHGNAFYIADPPDPGTKAASVRRFRHRSTSFALVHP